MYSNILSFDAWTYTSSYTWTHTQVHPTHMHTHIPHHTNCNTQQSHTRHLIYDEGCFTLDQLNSRIGRMELGFMESSNRPSQISATTLQSQDNNLLTQNGWSMWPHWLRCYLWFLKLCMCGIALLSGLPYFLFFALHCHHSSASMYTKEQKTREQSYSVVQ